MVIRSGPALIPEQFTIERIYYITIDGKLRKIVNKGRIHGHDMTFDVD